jgi:hypothetical protein
MNLAGGIWHHGCCTVFVYRVCHVYMPPSQTEAASLRRDWPQSVPECFRQFPTLVEALSATGYQSRHFINSKRALHHIMYSRFNYTASA